MTLLDYANGRSNVVLFWAGFGTANGDCTVLGHPDFDFAERNDLLDLEGTLDEEGDWHWDGKGSPTDDRANTIYKLHAFAHPEKWDEIVEEFDSGN